MTHDWEHDPRPLSECLAEWERALNGDRVTGARAAGARALRVPPTTYAGWRAGRLPQHEAMVRRLMGLASSP